MYTGERADATAVAESGDDVRQWNWQVAPASPVSLVLAQFPADVRPEFLDHIGEAVKPDL